MPYNPFRRERLISDYLPFVCHATDDIVLLDDGSVFAMIEIVGLPWETQDVADIVLRHQGLNRTLKNIASDSVILHFYQCRSMADPSVYPASSSFRTDFARTLDARYRARLFEGSLYRNRMFLGVQVRPPRLAGEFIGERVARAQKPADEAPEARIDRLQHICSLLLFSLSPYLPYRLGKRSHVFSEIAEAIAYAMTGYWREIGLTTGRLGNSMLSERIVVGRETIEFRAPGESWFGAMFGMRHYPSEPWPGMFNALLSAPYRFTLYQSYRFVSTQTAQQIMKRKGASMLSAGDPSKTQAAALAVATDQLASANWVFGDHSLSLLVFADTVAALRDVATAAWSNLASCGATISRESAALEAALFSFCPGNAHLRPRPGYITSMNMAAFAPFHAFPTGVESGYWGGPAALFRTMSGEPYRFHYHVGDLGNTFICGRAGSGKSTMLGFLAAQAERLGATVVLWDKDRGLSNLVQALGGIYLELKSESGLAPLKRLSNSPEDIEFLTLLTRGCIMADGGPRFSAEDDRRLHLGLMTVMSSLPPEDRWMWEVRTFLGVEENGIGARLEKWCWGRELGGVIDNPKDKVSLDADIIGFDQTHILDNVFARGPVMATLYHYSEKLIDGRRLLFIIDEFWKSLLDPVHRPLINDKIKTLRKRNAPMILATQSPRDALASDISHTIREQCPTQFYFTPGQASWEDYGEAGMGLTEREFEIVKGLPEASGQFLLRQGNISVHAQLPLAGLDDEIAILSGRESTTRTFNRIREEMPDADLATVLGLFHAARQEESA